MFIFIHYMCVHSLCGHVKLCMWVYTHMRAHTCGSQRLTSAVSLIHFPSDLSHKNSWIPLGWLTCVNSSGLPVSTSPALR